MKHIFCRLHDENGDDVYLVFNAHDYFVKVGIPSPPQKRQWFRVVSFLSFIEFAFFTLLPEYRFP